MNRFYDDFHTALTVRNGSWPVPALVYPTWYSSVWSLGVFLSMVCVCPRWNASSPLTALTRSFTLYGWLTVVLRFVVWNGVKFYQMVKLHLQKSKTTVQPYYWKENQSSLTLASCHLILITIHVFNNKWYRFVRLNLCKPRQVSHRRPRSHCKNPLGRFTSTSPNIEPCQKATVFIY